MLSRRQGDQHRGRGEQQRTQQASAAEGLALKLSEAAENV